MVRVDGRRAYCGMYKRERLVAALRGFGLTDGDTVEIRVVQVE